MKLIIALITLLLCTPFIGGTIIWLAYPHIFAVFPHANTVISETLGWWDSVCLSFLCYVIFGRFTINNKDS